MVSATFISFIIQVAVFRYTRAVGAPIPAGEIIGPPTQGFSMLIATLWFFGLGVFMFSGFAIWSCKIYSDSEEEKLDKLESYFSSTSNIIRWSIFPNLLGVILALTLLVMPNVTSNTLRILGYGGGIDVCYEAVGEINKQSKIIRDLMLSVEVSDAGEKADSINDVRGELIFLANEKAYIRFPELSTPDNLSLIHI